MVDEGLILVLLKTIDTDKYNMCVITMCNSTK